MQASGLSRLARTGSLGAHRKQPLQSSFTGPSGNVARGNVSCPALADVKADAYVAARSASAPVELIYEQDKNGIARVKYQQSGWNYWTWRGHKIHYIQTGTQGPPVLLIHGYGASAYHWRYNIPALAADHRVFAVDMLGFGWSDKALVDNYGGAAIWTEQIADFIKDVVGGPPAVLVGNSLGGYAALSTAAQYPDLVRALVLVNSAGPLEDPSKPITEKTVAQAWYTPLWNGITTAAKRMTMAVAFNRAKQPENIEKVLRMVYASDANIDRDLIDSIVQPATDPNAAEVFYRINSNSSTGPSLTVNDLLKKLDIPVLLLWGGKDPWMTPARAERIMQLYPAAEKVILQSGHCPHDDGPVEANAALKRWLQALPL